MDFQETATRRARPEDVPAIVELVHHLARYERAAHECHLTVEQLHAALFCPQPALFGHVALSGQQVVGCALWFLNFSTWRGKHGIYVEDLFVLPEHRAKGLGHALLRDVARECQERGYGRLEWAVLDWNEPAIGFYASLGARPLSEWTIFRLSGGALASLALGGA